MARNPIVFNNGTLVSSAKVEIDGVIYDVDPAQYEGTTPLSANNLNQLQTNLYDYADDKIKNEYSESTENAYSCDYENNVNSYSTDEVKTNKIWIDGKPIYRKVSTGTTPSTNYTKFVDIPNLEKLVQGWGTVNIKGNDTTIPFVNLVNNKYFYFYTSSDGIYTHFSADIYGNKPFVFIAEYTKTTD